MDVKKCNCCGRKFDSDQSFLQGTSRWRLCKNKNLWFNCSCGSTLFLKKGKFPWYSPDNRLSASAKEVFNKIHNIDQLPHIPTNVMNIQVMLENQEASLAEITNALRQDPILGSQVLQTAQSLKATRNPDDKAIVSLEHAVTYSGRGFVKDLVQVAALKSFRLKTQIFDVDDHWHRSMLSGLFAEKLGKRFGLSYTGDELYFMGSLSNIGKIVLAMLFPEVADAIAKDASSIKASAPWPVLEVKHDSHQHTILGEIAAAFWGFPDSVLESSRAHHSWPLMGNHADINPDLAKTVNLSSILTHWFLLTPERIDNDRYHRLIASAGISESELDTLVTQIKEVRPLAA